MSDGHTVGAIGYLRVSTEEQAASGAGLEAQRQAVTAEASRRGWRFEEAVDAGFSAATLQRPALATALAELEAGQASVLVVSKLDRLSRSVSDFSALLDRARRRGWSVVCLDLGVDTTTATGELLANIVVSTAQYERRLIGQRTKDALAARRAAGVKLGRPRLLEPAVAERIRAQRAAGATLAAIADSLNADGVRTPTGRSWSAALVRKVALQDPVAA